MRTIPRENCICEGCGKLYVRRSKVKCGRLQRNCSVECGNISAGKKRVGRKLSDHHRMRISVTRRQDWIDGKYDGVQAGCKTKWYDYIKRDGTLIRCQGTWELKYAKYLDEMEIEFLTHRGALWYVTPSGKERVYLPDFYLVKTNTFVDVKNKYRLKGDLEKLACVRKHNSDVKLILTEDELKILGIKL